MPTVPNPSIGSLWTATIDVGCVRNPLAYTRNFFVLPSGSIVTVTGKSRTKNDNTFFPFVSNTTERGWIHTEWFVNGLEEISLALGDS